MILAKALAYAPILGLIAGFDLETYLTKTGNRLELYNAGDFGSHTGRSD